MGAWVQPQATIVRGVQDASGVGDVVKSQKPVDASVDAAKLITEVDTEAGDDAKMSAAAGAARTQC